MATQIPVYLFTGFLEAGKTTFIQSTLEDSTFNTGERTLVILCEEGETELDPSKFSGKNVFIQTLTEEEQITPGKLSDMLRQTKAERVLVEYNGMWMLSSLYNNLPKNWLIYQEFLLIDTRSFKIYNSNMRALVVDKLASCNMAVFKHYTKDVDKLELHKIVRAISRKTDIAYEYDNGDADFDDIQDPLPFDPDSPIIEIDDRDYAVFYRDISEEMNKYDGKTVRFKGYMYRNAKFPSDAVAFGRKVMTCCVEDITYQSFLCITPEAQSFKREQWGILQAHIEIKYHRMYGQKGPILTIEEFTPCEPLGKDDAVATFF